MSEQIIPKLIIHGGAGQLEGDIAKRVAYHDALTLFIMESYRILFDTDARTAVIHCLQLFEDDPIFNAGTGSRLQMDGRIRMSASFMDGRENKFSAVINIQNIQHPIDVAELLSHEKNTVLAGDCATKYARNKGIEHYDPVTPQRLKEYKDRLANQHGTVGVVALDRSGNIVAATSTGGIGNELPGRVSDSATVAGNYASLNAGVSCTGIGEHIMSSAAAVKVVNKVDDGISLKESIENIISEAKAHNYEYGLIGVDRFGNMEVGKTTENIYFAKYDGKTVTTFYKKVE